MVSMKEKKEMWIGGVILDSAHKLIKNKGFKEAKIEDIAKDCEVSVGTIYNYFASKNGLLIAVVEIYTLGLTKRGEIIVAKPGKDPELAFFKLLWLYMEKMMKTYSRDFLRELMASSFLQPQAIGKDMARLDYILIEQISRLMAQFQSSNKINKNISIENGALVLYGVMGLPVMIYMIEEKTSINDVKKHLKGGLKVIFQGWRV